MIYLSPSQWTAATDLYNNQLLVGGQSYWVQDAQKSWSLTNPGGDNTTLRFQVNQGDVWQQGDGTITPLKNRAEIAGTTQYADGTNIHIAYDWTVETGATNTATWLTCGQLRQAANDGFSAPFAIMMNGEHMRISVEEGGTDASWSNFHDLYYDPNAIVRGHQYHMQIDARFDAVNGHLDVIRDGVTLVNYDGPLGWANMGSVYWKEGVYRADAPESMAMDYGNLSITTGTQTATSTTTTTSPTTTTPTTTTTTPTTTTPTTTTPTTTTDTTPPTLSGVAEKFAGWTNQPGEAIWGNVSDAGSGVKAVHVYDNGNYVGDANLYSGGVWSRWLDLGAGSHSITVTAEDNGGNISAPVSTGAPELIDLTAPTVTITNEYRAGNPHNPQLVVNFSAHDETGGSGLNHLTYWVDHNATDAAMPTSGVSTLSAGAVSLTLPYADKGEYLHMAATDNAGNVSTFSNWLL